MALYDTLPAIWYEKFKSSKTKSVWQICSSLVVCCLDANIGQSPLIAEVWQSTMINDQCWLYSRCAFMCVENSAIYSYFEEQNYVKVWQLSHNVQYICDGKVNDSLTYTQTHAFPGTPFWMLDNVIEW